MIRHNWFYKLVSVAVALVLWTYVNTERNPQAIRTMTVPVELRRPPQGTVSDSLTREVTLSVRGAKTIVDGIRKDDVSAWADLARVKTPSGTSESTVGVRARVSGVPEGELDVSVSPRSVKVRVEALTTRRIRVEMRPVAPPSPDYSFGVPVITPPGVRISGKSTDVATVRRVMIDFGGRVPTGPVDSAFDVVALDAHGGAVERVAVEPRKVRLKLALVAMPATRSVLVSPNIVGEPKYPARVGRFSVSPSSVSVAGKPTALVGVSTLTTEAVSIEGAASTVVREVALRVPPGVRVVGRNTVRVTVYIGQPQ